MRIAFLTHQWPGARMGGIGSAVRQTALAMAQAGHDVHVFSFTLPADVRETLPSEFTIHEVADLAERIQRSDTSSELAAAIHVGGDGVYRLALGWLLCEQLLRVHAERPFDIVETPEVEALGLPLMLNDSFRSPVLVQLHCCTAIARLGNDARPIREGEAPAEPGYLVGQTFLSASDARTPASERTLRVGEYAAPWQARMPAPPECLALPNTTADDTFSAVEFAAMHLADALSAPTRAVVDATRLCCPISGDVQIIPHPFIANRDYSDPPGDGPILFVGRLERLKGVETIVEALNDFLPRHPVCVFRFVGPDTNIAPTGGSMQQWLRSRLDPLIRNRVQFAGEISSEQIATEWARASFGVMPSLWENFSMAACEAMSSGRTLIVAAGTGSVELVGDAGLVVQRESPLHLCLAMERLWTDRGARRRMSRAAFDRMCSEFSPQRVAQQREQFYRDAIRQSGARSKSDLARRLELLPPKCTAAILPALIRLAGALAGADVARQTPGSRLLRIMDDIEKRSGAPARVVLYGAGKHTARLLSERHRWEARRHRVVGIIDDHPRFAQSPVYLDLPVQSLESARARLLSGEAMPPIVLSTDTYEDQFWVQCAPLREAGVPVLRLYPQRQNDV